MPMNDRGSSGIVVFDHDHRQLQMLALTVGARVIDSAAAWADNDERVVKAMLDEGFDTALLHLSNEAWTYLLGKARADQIIVRFSTEGFTPAMPDVSNGLALRTIPKLQDLKTEDLSTVLAILRDTAALNSLRDGVVPRLLGRYFQFADPNYLMAFHILCLGWMAACIEGNVGGQAESEGIRARLDHLGWAPDLIAAVRPYLLQKGMWRRSLGIVEPGSEKIDPVRFEHLKVALAEELGARRLGGEISDWLQTIVDGEASDPVPNVLAAFDIVTERLGL